MANSSTNTKKTRKPAYATTLVKRMRRGVNNTKAPVNQIQSGLVAVKRALPHPEDECNKKRGAANND